LLPVIIFLIVQGWDGGAASWNYKLLKEALERIPFVRVFTPTYLDAQGGGAQFRSKKTIDNPKDGYAMMVRDYYLYLKSVYPDATIMVMGHSLGGIIVRHLHNLGYFLEENMIFVGTPHKGISARSFIWPIGFLLIPLLKVIARERFCGVPVFYQLLEGSDFLEKLNKNGLPRKSIYIGGLKDPVVGPDSSVPDEAINRIWINCGHSFFPSGDVDVKKMSFNELDCLTSHTATLAVVSIVNKRLENLKTRAALK